MGLVQKIEAELVTPGEDFISTAATEEPTRASLSGWTLFASYPFSLFFYVTASVIIGRCPNLPPRVSLYDLHAAMDEGVKVRRRYSGEGLTCSPKTRPVIKRGSSGMTCPAKPSQPEVEFSGCMIPFGPDLPAVW